MIYFTSDLHIYHTNVIKYCNRPFNSVEEMNEALVNNWNSVVGLDDVVYCLGDFSMAIRPVEAFTKRLNGIKYLIPGNHDWCHSYHRKSRDSAHRSKWIQQYTDWGWIVLPEQTTIELPFGTLNMCHHPYRFVTGDHHDDKYERWRPKDDGRWLLCGHVHEKWKVVENMINVGVDQWNFTPVSLSEVEKIVCTTKHLQ